MTDAEKELVHALAYLEPALANGDHKFQVLRARLKIEALSKEKQLLIDANKLLNDKCERLMGENKGLKENVHSLEDRIGRLDEIIKSRQARIDELIKEVERLEYVAGDRPDYAGPDTKTGEVVQLKGVEPNPEDMKGIPAPGDWERSVQLRIKDEENAKLKDQLAAANDATVSRDATIRELRDDVRRISVESNDFRNRMFREQNLVSQLASAVETLADKA